MIKLVDKKELLLERKRIKEQEEKKRLEKTKKKAEADAKQAALNAIRKIPPFEMFKSETDKYSKFDDKVKNFTFAQRSKLCSIANPYK